MPRAGRFRSRSAAARVRRWPVVSVDDFCGCQGGAEGLRRAASGSAPEQPGEGSPPAAERQEPGRFVLYFDFGQLRLGGRTQAIETAKRWVRETMADHTE